MKDEVISLSGDFEKCVEFHGIIHVPVLVHVLNFPVHIATATSHFILAIMALTGTVLLFSSRCFPFTAFCPLLTAYSSLPGAFPTTASCLLPSAYLVCLVN